MAPTTARAGAPTTGMTADVAIKTGDAVWANENAILDGRYIYSIRGGTALIDRFDIAGGTAGAGAWANVVYQGTETFGQGGSGCINGKYLYLRNNNHRYFKYSITGNHLEPLANNLQTEGGAVVGQKIWVKNLDATGTPQWLYSHRNTGTELYRLLLF